MIARSARCAVADLQAAEASLTQLNTQVRNSRAARQAMGPGVQKARDEWLVTYSAAKRLVEAVLAEPLALPEYGA